MLANVNPLAILVATLVSMAIGAGWYSTLSKTWIKAAGFDGDKISKIEKGGNPLIYVLAAFCHLIMAYILSGIIYHAGGLSVFTGALSAFLVWAGFVLTSMIVNHRFQMQSWMLTIIDAGHYLVVLLAQGIILGWFGI